MRESSEGGRAMRDLQTKIVHHTAATSLFRPTLTDVFSSSLFSYTRRLLFYYCVLSTRLPYNLSLDCQPSYLPSGSTFQVRSLSLYGFTRMASTVSSVGLGFCICFSSQSMVMLSTCSYFTLVFANSPKTSTHIQIVRDLNL